MHLATETRQTALQQSSHADLHEKCTADDTVTATDMEIPADTTTTNDAFCSMPNYKLYIFVDIHSHTLTPTERQLDTAASLKPINAGLDPKE